MTYNLVVGVLGGAVTHRPERPVGEAGDVAGQDLVGVERIEALALDELRIDGPSARSTLVVTSCS